MINQKLKLKNISLILFMICCVMNSLAQDTINYSIPVKYEIAEISVSGSKYYDKDLLVNLSGLAIGQTVEVPGDDLSKAIDKYWKTGMFSDIKVSYTKIVEKKIYLDFFFVERPRLTNIIYLGCKKTEVNDLEDDVVKIKPGDQVTEFAKTAIVTGIKKHFKEKGYYNVSVNIYQKDDTTYLNSVKLVVSVDKKKKVKINQIDIEGNLVFEDNKVERYMKGTKEKAFRNSLRTKKFKEDKFKEDKLKIITKYNAKGYRDAEILSDSIYYVSDGRMNIVLKILEGRKYYFRNIYWVGNTKFSSKILSDALKIKKGDVYDQELLEKRLIIDEDAVGNIYLNDGYLFYSCDPIEVSNENDSIDLELRIREGRQATVDHVTIVGNTKTNERVIRREVRTLPGELFSKADITRTIRELAQLGHFDPEKLNVSPVPNPENATVDLEYIVEEKANDQVELSGGWGNKMIIGTIGLKFNNFSAKDVFKKKAWRPIPSGDGQQLSLRVASTGKRYQQYSITFVEPWLGGKKPNSLSVNLYHSARNYETEPKQSMLVSGASIGLGRRLKWPDDYFSIYHELSYQKYNLNNWSRFIITDGKMNNVSLSTVLSRSSIDNPLYTRSGSSFTLSLQVTPPYSLLNKKDYSESGVNDLYKWIEFHKWKFKGEWYHRLVQNLVLMTRYEWGYVGNFNKYRVSPFERFVLGGSGLSGWSYYGEDVIAQRGYEDGSLSIEAGSTVYNKTTLEIRYPFTLSPSATIYGLLFLEAGNAWNGIKEYNPFALKRSAGVGVRLFLPMLGMMGVDWGYGFDPALGNDMSKSKSQFHFTIGQQF